MGIEVVHFDKYMTITPISSKSIPSSTKIYSESVILYLCHHSLILILADTVSCTREGATQVVVCTQHPNIKLALKPVLTFEGIECGAST